MKPLYLLILMSAVSHLAHDAARFSVSLYAIKQQASPAIIGALGAMFALLPAISSLAIGRWVDRLGARGPMTLSAAMMVAGCLASFLWESVVALFVTSVVVGTFYNAFFVTSTRQLGLFGRPGEHVGNIGLSSTGYSIAIMLAPLVAGFAIDGWGHAYTFLMIAALPLLPFAIIGLGRLKFPERVSRQRQPTDKPDVGVLRLVRTGPLRHIFIANIASQIAWSLYVFLMPLYGSEIGMSASRIGLVMTGFSLTTVLVRAVLPMFVRLLTTWQLLLLSLAVASLCLASFPFFSGFAMLMGLGILLGVCLGLSGPMALALIYECAPPERLGEILGLRIMLMNTSFTVVPLLSGTITAIVGLGPVFWLLAGTLGAGTLAVRQRWSDPSKEKN